MSRKKKFQSYIFSENISVKKYHIGPPRLNSQNQKQRPKIESLWQQILLERKRNMLDLKNMSVPLVFGTQN